MSANQSSTLNDVSEMLIFPLYVRALESQRPDALLHDEHALALIQQIDPERTRVNQIKMDEGDRLALILRNREFDCYARAFLARCPQSVVVHIGCGLDTRFERVDNGQVEWFDLDLPEVIELRRRLIGGEGPRCHLLAGSVFDRAWIDTVSALRPRPFLFLAEGVLMYFEPAQVRSLVFTLRDHFPGAELVFDAFSPFLIWANNRRMARSKVGARYHWGLRRGQDLEAWGQGICLLDHWYPFDRPEPRMGALRWIRFIPPLAKVMGIFHYRLEGGQMG